VLITACTYSLQVIVHKRREEEPAVVAEAVPAAPAAKAAKKKEKKKDTKPSATEAAAAAAAAAAVADSTAEQQDDDSMQVVEPAAVAEDAAAEQELTAEAAAATAGVEQQDGSADEATASAAADADSAAQHAAKGTGKNHKKNQRKKRNKLLKEAAADAAAVAPAAAASAALQRTAQWSLTDEQAATMAQWTYLGVPLHPALLFNLHKLGFTQPTAIQRATLPKAILGRRDIVGAAETGSGKTLAYGLPILSAILHSMDDTVAAAAAAAAAGDSTDTAAATTAAVQKHPHQLPLQALILCPTRELALQVTLHLTAVSENTGISIVSVVGGLAEVKQRRLLKRRPAVVVATPGRLWEMRMSEQHLRDLSGLRYLVIDEADRMTEKGRFDELGKLMRVMTPDSDTAAAAAAAAALKAVKGGKRGAKKQQSVKGSKKHSKHSSSSAKAAVDESWMQTEQWLIDDADTTKDDNSDDNNSSDDDGDYVATTSPAAQSTVKAAVARQIFIYSATLSMQSEKKPSKKGFSKSKSSNSKDAPEANLERIMEVVGMVNKPSVVDLSQGTATTAVAAVENDDGDAPQDEEQPPPALPENLTLAHVKSLQMEKDAWLYLFCTQYSGRTLVFVNAIVMARRLAEVLKLLRIPCAALHAQMQQRQRLRSLDFLRAEPTAVLIATDVAARGLDVPSVDHVVHYDMPRSAADFVHR
jgi:ATP-dependent RNA helicase DDX24/MAK5